MDIKKRRSISTHKSQPRECMIGNFAFVRKNSFA